MDGQIVEGENVFLQTVETLRQASLRACKAKREFSREQVIELLQSVLAAEVTCVLRYTLLSVSRDALRNRWLATEFQAQADDERRHMIMVAKRIEVLGGRPDFDPAVLAARVSALSRCNASFAVRLQHNLAAEQCVLEHYRELAAWFEDRDPETAEILQDILQDEEDHTNDMQDLLVACA